MMRILPQSFTSLKKKSCDFVLWQNQSRKTSSTPEKFTFVLYHCNNWCSWSHAVDCWFKMQTSTNYFSKDYSLWSLTPGSKDTIEHKDRKVPANFTWLCFLNHCPTSTDIKQHHSMIFTFLVVWEWGILLQFYKRNVHSCRKQDFSL